MMIKEPVAASVTLTNNTKLSYEKWKNMNIEQKPEIVLIDFWVPIVNMGHTPMTDVSMGVVQTEHEITKQDLIRINKTPLTDLPVDDHYYHSFSIPWKHITQLNTTPVFVGISIKYNAADNICENKQCSEVIYKIDDKTISLL